MGSQQPSPFPFAGIKIAAPSSDVPDGALGLASNNVILRKANELESRRGLALALSGLRYDKLIAYQNRLLLHRGSDGLMQTAADPFSALSSTFTTLAPNPAGGKVQAAVMGGRLFLTSSTGLKVLDSATAADLREAGGPIAPCISSASTAAGAWFANNKRVAYTYTLGRVTEQGLQIVGPPSGRRIVENTSGAAAQVTIDMVVPPGLDETFFVQVWRSAQVDLTFQPDDDPRLVYERTLTQQECTSLNVNLVDVVPDDLRGEYLYTSRNAGEGIAQANQPPPIGETIVSHKGYLWLGSTTPRQELSIRLMAVGGTNGLQTDDTLVITGFAAPIVLVADSDFSRVVSGSASFNVEQTALNIVAALNTIGSTDLWAEYISSPDDVPGEIRLFTRASDGVQFSIWADMQDGGGAWSKRDAWGPSLAPIIAGSAGTRTFTLQRVANVVTATVSSGTITGMVRVGEQVIMTSPPSGFGAGPHVVTGITGTTITWAETGANLGPSAATVIQIYAAELATSEGISRPARLHFSKFEEPEAWPFGNYVDIGGSDKEIVALASTRETLWVFKADGLFRITGDDEDTFDVERMDQTVIAVSRECVQPFAEAVVAWTTSGVILLSESTFENISEDIQPLLREYLKASARSGTDQYGLIGQAFLVVDIEEGLVRLHLPGASRTLGGTIEGAGEALVWCRETAQWARWTWNRNVDSPLPLTFGAFNPLDRRVYYCDGIDDTGGEGRVWAERARRDAKEWQDDNEAGDQVEIDRRIVFSFHHGQAPLRDKRWDELVLLLLRDLEQTPSIPGAFSMRIATELEEPDAFDTPFGLAFEAPYFGANLFTVTPATSTVRCMVPIVAARGRSLIVQIDCSGSSFFTLERFGLAFEVLNSAIQR